MLRFEASTRINLADVARRDGAFDEARQHLARALELSTMARYHSTEVVAWYGLGLFERTLGRWREARSAFREVVDRARSACRPRDEAKGWLGLAEVAIEEGTLEAALQHLERVEALASESDGEAPQLPLPCWRSRSPRARCPATTRLAAHTTPRRS